ncbi:MAG: serine--tRNA ligase [Methanoregulaceae archaeon]|nr:serine--tRNA ligase [Methanoregulaceae archaeon]
MSVRFNLDAGLLFNADIPAEAAATVEKMVGEANKTLFRKGVPAGVPEDEIGRIEDFSIAGSVLGLRIRSGPYTRAHDALFRFRKLIAPSLGKFRLGLRDMEIRSFWIEMRGEFPEGFRMPKLPFILSADRSGDTLKISLRMEAADLENKVPDRLVRLIEEKFQSATYGGKAEHWELIFSSGPKRTMNDSDPTEQMIKQGWIRHALSRGQWIHGPQSVRLWRTFEKIVLDEIIAPLGFTEMVFPKLTPWEVWKKSGHAKGVYPEIYYVCTPKTRDPEYWEDVGDYFKVTGEVPVDMIRERIDGPIGGLCYAQCPSFWPFVQGETIANDCLPIRVFDRSGTSHRYESGGIHGIERVDEFHRMEILWLGTAEQTVGIADRLHEAYMRVFENILELEWRCARVTPWFMAQEGMVGTAQDTITTPSETACCADRVGTTDYEALLPYSGSWLEFQNVSINGNKYPKGFSVKIQSGTECWSGCSGIGLERWSASFLAQKGLDPANWPEKVAKIYGEPEEIFRFM